jgi:hypothetical protein
MIARQMLSRIATAGPGMLLMLVVVACARPLNTPLAITASPAVHVAASDSVLAHETFTIQSVTLGELARSTSTRLRNT